jgi:hypothetical protein
MPQAHPISHSLGDTQDIPQSIDLQAVKILVNFRLEQGLKLVDPVLNLVLAFFGNFFFGGSEGFGGRF